jgi:hypothetical protein
MKSVLNIQFSKLKARPDSSSFATSGELLLLVLEQAPPQGFDFATMRIRSKIADVVGKTEVGGTIELEDADYTHARDAVASFRWGSNQPELVKFAELFGL